MEDLESMRPMDGGDISRRSACRIEEVIGEKEEREKEEREESA